MHNRLKYDSISMQTCHEKHCLKKWLAWASKAYNHLYYAFFSYKKKCMVHRSVLLAVPAKFSVRLM